MHLFSVKYGGALLRWAYESRPSSYFLISSMPPTFLFHHMVISCSLLKWAVWMLICQLPSRSKWRSKSNLLLSCLCPEPRPHLDPGSLSFPPSSVTRSESGPLKVPKPQQRDQQSSRPHRPAGVHITKAEMQLWIFSFGLSEGLRCRFGTINLNSKRLVHRTVDPEIFLRRGVQNIRHTNIDIGRYFSIKPETDHVVDWLHLLVQFDLEVKRPLESFRRIDSDLQFVEGSPPSCISLCSVTQSRKWRGRLDKCSWEILWVGFLFWE